MLQTLTGDMGLRFPLVLKKVPSAVKKAWWHLAYLSFVKVHHGFRYEWCVCLDVDEGWKLLLHIKNSWCRYSRSPLCQTKPSVTHRDHPASEGGHLSNIEWRPPRMKTPHQPQRKNRNRRAPTTREGSYPPLQPPVASTVPASCALSAKDRSVRANEKLCNSHLRCVFWFSGPAVTSRVATLVRIQGQERWLCGDWLARQPRWTDQNSFAACR